MSRREVDDEPADLALAARLKFGRQHLDVPTQQEFRLWIELPKATLNEDAEILP
jgi:hypothetical protein